MSTPRVLEPTSSWRRQGAAIAGMVRNERRSAAIGRASIIASHSHRDSMGPSAEIRAAPQDSFSLIYMFENLTAHEFWSDEGHVNVPDLPGGSLHIMDLRPSGNARITTPFDTTNIAIPRDSLNALAEQIGTAAPKDLRIPEAWLWRDPVITAIQGSIARGIAAGPEVDDLVFDHLLLALLTHVAITYGEMRKPSPGMRGSLTPAQLKRAEDVMMDRLGSPTALSDVARCCDLSPSHFSRAFRLATGRTPSAWRMARRIELSQKLLREDGHSIAQVALLSGFADQSHFTRTFAREVGQPPADWLRSRGPR
jgi:AraC family transcriptional regulator